MGWVWDNFCLAVGLSFSRDVGTEREREDLEEIGQLWVPEGDVIFLLCDGEDDIAEGWQAPIYGLKF